MKKIVLIGLTHPPSSCRWRSPLHRVVCYLESPRDKRWTQEWKRRHLRMSDLWRSHFSLRLTPPGAHFTVGYPIFPQLTPSLLLLPAPHLRGWVCARSWCRRPWRSGRWRRVRRPPLQTRGHQRWSGDSWGCSPRSAEEDCARNKSIVELVIISAAAERGNIQSTALHRWIHRSQRGHFMCESALPEVRLSAVRDNNRMEQSLSYGCQFIQNNTPDCPFVLIFHMILTSWRIIAVI